MAMGLSPVHSVGDQIGELQKIGLRRSPSESGCSQDVDNRRARRSLPLCQENQKI